jgi:hypothetical protein
MKLRIGLFSLVLFVSILCVLDSGAQTPSSTWQKEVVDAVRPGDADAFVTFVIDQLGNFHLAYTNKRQGSLVYAFRGKSAPHWDKADVDSGGASYESIAADSKGFAHIAYNTAKLTGLHYAFWDGSRWQKLLLDTERTSETTSLVLGEGDQARISYYLDEYPDRRYARNLKFASFDDKSWFLQTVDHRSGAGRWNAVAVDSKGRPCISYSSLLSGSLALACKSSESWDRDAIDVSNEKTKRSVDFANAIVFDSEGRLHVAYMSASERQVVYARQEDGAWKKEVVDSLVSTGSDTDRISLKLDKSGQPHLVYYDSRQGQLKYAARGKSDWNIELIDTGAAGEYASLSLDEKGQPYVAYYASIDRELRIAHRVQGHKP